MRATLISIIAAVVLIGGAFVFTRGGFTEARDVPPNNVTVVDGTQIIEIRAKGGFAPRKSIAKAGMPTILRFQTNGTFDCSSVVRIPSMDIGKNLPLSGVTDIALHNPELGILEGSCGMGMYPFEIEFQG